MGKNRVIGQAVKTAIGHQAITDKPIKKSKNREVLTNTDLIYSYLYIYKKQTKKNKSTAIKEAIRLFDKDISDEDLIKKAEALTKEINRKTARDKFIF